MRRVLDKGRKKVFLNIPYAKGGIIDSLHRDSEVLGIEYKDDCIEAEAVVTPETYGKIREYISERE